MITTWIAEAVEARMRCRSIALELQMIMGKDRGRVAAWCCRFLAFIPTNPGYESLLRACREMALAGRL